MRYTRDYVDRLGVTSGLTPVLDEDGDLFLVNGMGGKYQLWYPQSDRSVLPCLTGEIGGMVGAWENWIVAWHLNNFHQFDGYVDVGANGGYFAGLAANFGLPVWAFEANPEYSKALTKSQEDNNWEDFLVFDSAVSDVDGESVILTVPEELHGGASIAGRETNLPGKKIKVETETLDNLFKQFKPTKKSLLIKMDIEGAEQMAFHGASKINKTLKPTYIIEYTPRHYDGNFFEELSEYGSVTMVDFSGGEVPVTQEQADAFDDWITLVIRPH